MFSQEITALACATLAMIGGEYSSVDHSGGIAKVPDAQAFDRGRDGCERPQRLAVIMTSRCRWVCRFVHRLVRPTIPHV